MNKFRSTFSIFVKGIAMGAADAVPGVSGGTIALITGIYEKLILALKSFDRKAFSYLKKLQLKELWIHIHGNFLISLILGIGISLISLANLITYLMIYYPIQLWSFFFGLILVSSIVVLKEIKQWSFGTILGLASGIVIAFLLTEITPASTTNALWFIFISGAIAICAMILPGISGAFILLILGKYEYIVGSLKSFDLPVIGVFMLGCIAGLLSFARVVSWLFKYFHGITIAILSGFMIGSLNKIWPWKIVTLFRENSKGEQVPLLEKNVFPGEFVNVTGQDSFLMQALLFIAFGVLIVIILEKVSSNTH